MASTTATDSGSTWRALDELAFAYAAPVAKARLKQEFSDFKVSEDLGFKLTGSGEHLYLQLKKIDLSTTDVAKKLASTLQERVSAIGYAGMKDRRGECTQWFSVPANSEKISDLSRIEKENLQILNTQRNARKLKIGSHKLNRFEITLRECRGGQVEFESRLNQIETGGIPNYFGSQRFGKELSNLQQLNDLLLDYQNPEPQKPKRFKRGMVISAARAYLFNQLLSIRVANGSWDKYLAGDVLNLNGTARSFKLDMDEWTEELEQRLGEFDIHITGPLAGVIDSKDKYTSSGEAADIENAVFAEYTSVYEALKVLGATASRRSLRFMPENLNWAWLDEHTLKLDFALQPGAYATSLLREVCSAEN
ncbi:MAG: tRNA pseudouridine(13) synthase TruD [Gammaproteobacteria bacterium]|nr:tRNA pseudouridine(13) synthase TruD [Gammaproteobacteria bacterium]